jgi:hypothetical protein
LAHKALVQGPFFVLSTLEDRMPTPKVFVGFWLNRADEYKLARMEKATMRNRSELLRLLIRVTQPKDLLVIRPEDGELETATAGTRDG